MSDSKLNNLTTVIMGEITILFPAFILLLSGLNLTGAIEIANTFQQILFILLGAIGATASIWYNISSNTAPINIAGRIADTVTIVGPALIAVLSLLNLTNILDWAEFQAQALTAVVAFASYIASYIYDKYTTIRK